MGLAVTERANFAERIACMVAIEDTESTPTAPVSCAPEAVRAMFFRRSDFCSFTISVRLYKIAFVG